MQPNNASLGVAGMMESDGILEARRALGCQLADYRRAAGYGQAELGAYTAYSRSTIANVETGRQSPPRDFWERCDATLATGGALSAAHDEIHVMVRDHRERKARAAQAERAARIRRLRQQLPSEARTRDGSTDLVEGEWEAIRRALSNYAGFGAAPEPTLSLAEARRLTTEVHRRYQAADYSRAASLLPGLIGGVETLVSKRGCFADRSALAAQSCVYTATAKLVTKVGDPQLAWLAADRAANAALRVEDALLSAAAAYQVACAFLEQNQVAEAERIAVATAENLSDSTPLGLSLRGALMLISSIIAGRRKDRSEATERLTRAQQVSDLLGEDGNYGWTGFGPTNVRIHSVSVAVELDDASEAIARAEHIDTSSLPSGLLSRRAQVHIDCAWAYAQCYQDAASVLNLLEAERVAPQTLHYNAAACGSMREMLKRERRSATPGLRGLARRAGLLEE